MIPEPTWYRGQHRKVSRAKGWRFALAPWLVISLVAGVLVSGAALGYAWLLRSTCRGEATTITVAAAPDQYTVLDELSAEWVRSQPSFNGTCAAVNVVQAPSADVAAGLRTSWQNQKTERPDVWVPDASYWLQLAAQDKTAARFLPDDDAPIKQVALTPTVLAIPEPLATQLHINAEASAADLVERFATTPDWASIGHPEWGAPRIGWTDLRTSASGLQLALALATEATPDAAINLGTAVALDQRVQIYEEATDSFLRQLGELTDVNQLRDAPIFPALERDIIMFNETNPAVRLTAVYPTEHPPAADYPYVALTAPWVSADKREIAAAFGDFLGGDQAKQTFQRAAFRSQAGNINGHPDLPAEITSANERPLAGDEISTLLATWTATRGAEIDAASN